ncbi:trypsin domain-containing protein [Ditylenchus destructor]|uniref:Trypsin domain-containing protein n=1 Tax=Ditylenchus destructor TaxID=166010 RepID=A0AAD4R074_9BILA|nr:trypsin domain-containing protein [Ditylenchus destructor]
MDNDIAVVKLATPLKFSKNVQPICLPSLFEEDATSKKENAVIAGWGIREFPGVLPDVLLEGTEAFKDFKECQSQSDVPLVKKMQLCTQGTSTFTLEGDSGGPLFVKSGLVDEQGRPRWIEVGVTNVFARVSSYCGFIENATEGKVKCLS